MPDFTLSTTAMWAEIIGAGSIITGLIVGWFQLRNFRIQQRDVVAINLAQRRKTVKVPAHIEHRDWS